MLSKAENADHPSPWHQDDLLDNEGSVEDENIGLLEEFDTDSEASSVFYDTDNINNSSSASTDEDENDEDDTSAEDREITPFEFDMAEIVIKYGLSTKCTNELLDIIRRHHKPDFARTKEALLRMYSKFQASSAALKESQSL